MYCFVMQDDSMAPKILQGDSVIFRPISIRDNNDCMLVVVEKESGGLTLNNNPEHLTPSDKIIGVVEKIYRDISFGD